ncbi:hypothetical protein ACFWIZ_47065, partial [Streptomyces sp. NPDC127044]
MSTPATAAPRRVPSYVVRRVAPGLLLVLVALTGPFLAPHAIDQPVTAPYAPAGNGAPLGGDQLGRDVLSRLLHGGTALIGSALLVAVVVTGLATLIGCVAVLRPALGRAVERTADVAILLPPVLGIMLIALAWPDGGRLAVNTAAIVLGVPYAVRLVAGGGGPPRPGGGGGCVGGGSCCSAPPPPAPPPPPPPPPRGGAPAPRPGGWA